MAIVVNLWGAPCAGKSTMAAWLYHQLKIKGVEAELVREYAKELIWENRKVSDIQYYVTAEQARRLYTCGAKVIITDSPPALGAFYAFWNKSSYANSLTELCKNLEKDDSFKRVHMHILIEPGDFFSNEGRIHTKKESEKIHEALSAWFCSNYQKSWDMVINEKQKERILNHFDSISTFFSGVNHKNVNK